MGEFGPDFLLISNRGRVELLNRVEKPDLNGFVRKLKAFENYQFLVRKKSKLCPKLRILV